MDDPSKINTVYALLAFLVATILGFIAKTRPQLPPWERAVLYGLVAVIVGGGVYALTLSGRANPSKPTDQIPGAAAAVEPQPETMFGKTWKITRTRPDAVCEGRWNFPAAEGARFSCPLWCVVTGNQTPFPVPGNDSARCSVRCDDDHVVIDYERFGNADPKGDASCDFSGTVTNDTMNGASLCKPSDAHEPAQWKAIRVN